jgi:hypothetical protein
MADKKITLLIEAKNMLARGLSGAASSIAGFAKTIGSNLMNIWAGFKLAQGLITAVAKPLKMALQEAFKFESLTTQFKVLFGNLEQAKERMKELGTFAAVTPFKLDEIAKSSRMLHVFSQGAMGGTESLTLIGDAAAAVGQPLEDVSFWIGRIYANLKGGQPFGEAAMRLQEMGLVTPEVRTKMESLQKAGASNIEVWKVLQDRLAEFNGGMKELSLTGDGLVSTLQDNWSAAIRAFGQAMSEQAKGGIKELSDALTRLVETGEVDVWASRTVKNVNGFASAVASVVKPFKDLWNWAGKVDQAIGDFEERITGQKLGYSGRAVKEREEAAKAEEAIIREQAQARVKDSKEAVKANDESMAAKIEADMAKAQSEKEMAEVSAEAAKAEKFWAEEEEKLWNEMADEKIKTAEEQAEKLKKAKEEEADQLLAIEEERADREKKINEEILKEKERISKLTVAQFIEESKEKKDAEKVRSDEDKNAERLRRLSGGKTERLSKKDQEWLAKFDEIRKAGGEAAVAKENLAQAEMTKQNVTLKKILTALDANLKKQNELSAAG